MNKIQKIFTKLTLNDWVKVDLGHYKDFYLVGVKGKKAKKDIIDPEKLRKIKFELAIETGLKKKFITVAYLTINFEDITSSDAETNKLTAYAKYAGGPSRFYIRAVEAVDNSNTCYREGKLAVKINVNPQNLG